MSFKVGQKVKWTSSSNGTTKTKIGVIEDVIPAGQKLMPGQQSEADAYGAPRNHESYLVRVPSKTGKGRGKLYWPVANKLQRA